MSEWTCPNCGTKWEGDAMTLALQIAVAWLALEAVVVILWFYAMRGTR